MRMWDNFIQIAGVKSLNEAEMLIEQGIRFIGFPLRLTVNEEDITEEEAKNIITQIKDKAEPVLITYLAHSNEITKFCGYLGVNIVQLHGGIELSEMSKLRKDNPNLIVIKSLVVKENNFAELIKTIDELTPYVDAFITDTFDPETKAEGATGKTHDWNISAKLVAKARKPVILAGGLTPENVSEAIRFVKPAGVDSHTGVENALGEKDAEKVKMFVENALSAFVQIKK